MLAWNYVHEVKFSFDKNGRKRARYFSPRIMRWLPLPLQVAENLVSSGDASEVA